MGTRLGHALSGSGVWRPTPAKDEYDRWNHGDEIGPEGPDFRNYLARYGFEIPVDQKRIDEANGVVRNPGSFYSYGRGGSVTVIDPKRGKLYYAYAG